MDETLTLKAQGGVNAHLKVPALIAGMVVGADSIGDVDLLRRGDGPAVRLGAGPLAGLPQVVSTRGLRSTI